MRDYLTTRRRPSFPRSLPLLRTLAGRLARPRLSRLLPPRLLPPFGIVFLLTAVTVVIFRRQIFDHWTFPWDFVGGYTASPAFVAASVGSGHLFSWSPFVASGFPVAVDPQAGMYFPGWWLLGSLEIPATLRVLTTVQVAHVLFGAIGVLALARARRLGWSLAALAALAYLFFGGFYGDSEHADIVRGLSYLPWLLWTLTPSTDVGHWPRLIALPPLAWLIVTGAYPGQSVSFAIVGVVYLSVALTVDAKHMWRRYRTSLLLAAVSCIAVAVAVVTPYLLAELAHELHRVYEPTASVRASESIAPLDMLGLYLNNFAWTPDGTITSWSVGIPVLVGLMGVNRDVLRRHAPLASAGVAALALAMTPKIGFVGRAMASLPPLFPSRFPASDYKAAIAVALVVLAAEGWGQLARHRGHMAWKGALAGCVLVVGAVLAPATYAQPTRELWLVVVVIVASVALVLVRLPWRALVSLLAILIVVDGVREINDYRYLGRISPWQTPSSELALYRTRDGFVHELPAHLAEAPTTRPARIPPWAPISREPTGTPPDASGWVAEGYHMTDYTGTIERARWEAEHNPNWSRLLLEPWHGYTFPCARVGCHGSVHLPSPSTWHPSTAVHTIAYGMEDIVYSVNVSQPVLMVENELAIHGWRADSSKARVVAAGIPLRAWRLSPGHYQFTASYHERGRLLQELMAFAALLACLGCALTLRRAARRK